jgi:hypothetical protein
LDQQDRIELLVARRRRAVDAVVRHQRIVGDVDTLLRADQDEGARSTEVFSRDRQSSRSITIAQNSTLVVGAQLTAFNQIDCRGLVRQNVQGLRKLFLRSYKDGPVEASRGLQLTDNLRTSEGGDRTSQTVDVDLAGESEVSALDEKGSVAKGRAVVGRVGKVLAAADRVKLRDDRERDRLRVKKKRKRLGGGE